MEITQQIWGMTPEGDAIVVYTMTNSIGASVSLTNYGAAITSIIVPDKNGNMDDIVLGYEHWQDYVSDAPAMGKSIGRYAGRIARGKFSLNGHEYRLGINNPPNHIHGGAGGFQNQLWDARVETDRIVFSLLSPANEEGYPGELSVEACYDWDEDCNLGITYFAKTTESTIVNLTNHVYFNLHGAGRGTIHDHELQLSATKFLPTDNTLIPTGELEPVAGTPMDFTDFHYIGERIGDKYDQLSIGNGYDHSWSIEGYDGSAIHHAGTLREPESGRIVRVSTTQPAIHIYTGNWLAGCPRGKSDVEYQDHSGIAIECQAFPDSPNKPAFPNVTLNTDDIYEEHIIYSFSIES